MAVELFNYHVFYFCQAFSKKKIEERKDWLTKFMIDRRQRKEHNLPEVNLKLMVNIVRFVACGV